MKKQLKYYIIGLLVLTGLTACLDEKGVFEENGSYGIVELVLPARSTSTPYAVKTTTVEVEDIVELPVEINYTGINGAPQDVQVTIAIDDAAVAIYDATDKSKTILALPANLYELPASNTVTIPKGQKTAVYIIKLKPKTFDLTKSYALGVKIVSASAGIVSGNYSTGIYNLPVKSPWEGIYTVTIDWNLPESLADYRQYFPETLADIELKTQGPGIVRAPIIGDLFGGTTDFKFNPDATVGVAFSATTFQNVTVIESHSDVNTLTFSHKTSFSHASYGDFELRETYVQVK
ncbi:MAG: DUF1735 domain-containing protein [Candidatus Symbiothrix sp.]|nr:DUF1735 domain-containing protein [Candidatus Symbiothrix sp.]